MSEKLKKIFDFNLANWAEQTHIGFIAQSVRRLTENPMVKSSTPFTIFDLNILVEIQNQKNKVIFAGNFLLKNFFFLRRKNTDTREKIQQGWKEKGAPFRSDGAKRRIQGVSKRKKVVAQKEGYKVVTSVVLRRNGGVFSIKFLHIVLSCQLKVV